MGVVALKLLLDEMFTGLKDYLGVLGWDVLTVQEAGLQGAKDVEVVRYARNHQLLLITQDQKTAELSDLMEVKNVYISVAAISRIADEEIRRKYPDMLIK